MLNNSGTANLTDCTSAATRQLRRRRVQFRHGQPDRLHRQRQLRRRLGGGMDNVRRHGHPDRHDRRRQHDSSGAATSAVPASRAANNLIGTGGSGGLVNGSRRQHRRASPTPAWPRWATTAGRPRPWPCSPAAPPSAPGIAARLTARSPPTSAASPLDSPDPDIGAFQSQGFTLTPVAGSTPQSSAIGTAFVYPLAVTVTANNPVEPVDGGVVTFVARFCDQSAPRRSCPPPRSTSPAAGGRVRCAQQRRSARTQ